MVFLPQYKYTALPDPKSYIRLLSIKPSAEEFCGSVEALPISLAPPYVALSYAWGDEQPSKAFTCESTSLHVTPHLFEGIRQLCDLLEPSTRIWIDAICIDQSNADEKAGQIPLMTQTYASAERVLVWLGPAADGSDRVMDEMGTICAKLQAAKTPLSLEAPHEISGIPGFLDPFWRSVSLLWSRPWFDRLWVMQEVILAKNITFVIGNRTANLDLFTSFVFEANRSSFTNYAIYGGAIAQNLPGETITNLKSQREDWSRQKSNPLFLLFMGQHKKTREPVDRVYGLLGILDHHLKVRVPVDYTAEARRDYWKLYVTVGKLLLEAGYSELLQHIESEAGPGKLPSWCPNWNSTSSTHRLPNHFHAGQCCGKPPTPTIHLSHKTNDITLCGFQIGIISHLSDLDFRKYRKSYAVNIPRQDAAEQRNMMMRILYHYQTLWPDSKRSAAEHVARTLVADSSYDYATSVHVRNLHRDYAQDFEVVLQYLSSFIRRRPEETPAAKEMMSKHPHLYSQEMPSIWKNRSVFFTHDHMVGLASTSCRVQDIVCVFPGLRHPYILRRSGHADSFLLIGPAYVDGVMYGEALERRDISLDRDFVIE